MATSASQLRQDIYNLLDRVLETGEPLEVERKGRTLRIVAEPRVDWFHRVATDPTYIAGDPEDLVSTHEHWEWEPEWETRP